MRLFEEEMQVKRDRINQLTRALDKLEQDQRELQDRFKGVAAENAELTERLRQMGMNVEDSKKSMSDMNKLIDELKARDRAAQARLATFRGMLEKFRR